MKYQLLCGALFAAALMASVAAAQHETDHDFEPGTRNARLEADARGGDPAAQAALGRVYFYGGSAVRNPAAAMRWFERAAAQGQPEGQYHVAYAFGQGEPGREQDWGRAFELYEQAAGAGHAASQFALGFLHYVGRGTKQDFAEAANWYRKAARQGFPNAQFNLAGLFFDGTGVRKDMVQSYKWFLIAKLQVEAAKIEDEYVMHGADVRGADLATAAQRNLVTLSYLMSDEELEEAVALAEQTAARWELIPVE